MDDSNPKLPPLPPEAFDGETQSITLESRPCSHRLTRRGSTTVECEKCGAGWIDLGLWVLNDGQVVYARTPDEDNEPL